MKKFAVAAVAAGMALALAACSTPQGAAPASTPGAAGGTTAAAPAGELKKVTIGALPIAPTAVIHLGEEKGFFEKNGLDITIETGQGGAALLPAVVSGTMQFATGNPASLLQARDKNLDVQVIASFTYDSDEGVHAVISKADSPIKTAKDLAGKTVAINTLKSMGDLLTMEAVAKDGGDPASVKFVELPFPNMQAALEANQVDAVWTPEPFMSIMLKDGAHVVTYDGKDTVPGHPTMMFFTSGNLIQSDPELVSAMQKAINEAMDYGQENPDELRQAAVDKMNVSPEMAEVMKLEDFGGPVRTAEVKAMGDLMTKYKFVTNPADVDGLLAGAQG